VTKFVPIADLLTAITFAGNDGNGGVKIALVIFLSPLGHHSMGTK